MEKLSQEVSAAKETATAATSRLEGMKVGKDL